MAQTERLYHIKRWLDAGRCLQRDWLLTELGVSRATLTRDLALLRDRMQAPIVFDAERGGWRLDATQSGMADAGELPGLWFNAEEVAALLTMQRMLEQLDASGLLARHIEPLRRRLQTMLGTGLRGEAAHIRRIRLSTVAARRLHLAQFQAVGTALLQRRRLSIDYHGRGRDERHLREVSPQRLVHYRDNWYLDPDRVDNARVKKAVQPHPLEGGALFFYAWLQRALAGIVELRAGREGVLTVRLATLAPDDVLCQAAMSFRSVTEFVVARHAKRTSAEQAVIDDVRRECERCKLPVPREVRVTDIRGVARVGVVANVEMSFAVAVSGPILLGKTRFLGGGLFCPTRGQPRA